MSWACARWRQTGKRAGVARQDEPRRRLDAGDAADHGGRQVVAVRDNAGAQFIRGELFPDGILMAVEDSVAAVGEMRAEPRSGRNRGADAVAARRTVSQRYDDAGLCQSFDERQSAW